VSISEVTDPSLANIILDNGTTSASGSADDGVLGCYNPAAGEITLLQGWDWYAGADPTQIGPDQYDFQTTITHELGHALGLGGVLDPTSPMYEILATGQANRNLTVADLNIPDEPIGVDPLRAAPHHASVTASLTPPAIPASAAVLVLSATASPAAPYRASSPRMDSTSDRLVVAQDRPESRLPAASNTFDVGTYSGAAGGCVWVDVTGGLPALDLPREFLDRLFEQDSIFRQQLDSLPQSEEPRNMAERLAPLVADVPGVGQWGDGAVDALAEEGTAWVEAYSPGRVAILRWEESRAECDQVANTQEAQAAMAVLAAALAGGYGLAQRRERRPNSIV
jgi:hypothetical protein